MKIAMISGSWPPERCGIGDYSDVLSRALEAEGADVVRIERKDWSIRSLFSYRHQLTKAEADIHHIQYPSVGYGRSILPSLTPYLGGTTPSVVTLHEYEIFKPYRKPWFFPFAHRSKARIFSREAELTAFRTAFRKDLGQDLVLPIGSNIPSASSTVERLPDSIVFFGLFWPGKGLEEFLDLARLLREAGQDSRRLTIIGAPVANQEGFAKEIRKAADKYEIHLHEGLPPLSVAKVLATHEYAYLPYPDGADERRGTLAAAIVNGCIPVTRHGAGTPDWLKTATIPADTPLSASMLFQDPAFLTNGNYDLTAPLAFAARRYDWAAISAQHMKVYRALLSEGIR
ncbi:hypothetical protein [Roseibium algae]|uniref:Glycosyltransferase involved in cell wall biosynthesis n=1 Tax=Roseibium algae TaxID=3123038 RepID=A0ABU8TQU4_9HYPH